MEPNVDRGMWAVLALLIAVGIGAITVMAFPTITEGITSKMSNSTMAAEIVMPPGMEIIHLATDEDFSGDVNGGFRYIGTNKHIEIPPVIKGVDITSYSLMFNKSNVEKVISTNKNITRMDRMFEESDATYLDLSELDTSNVTNFYRMFIDSKTKSLNISTFDTSKATSMSSMFNRAQATNLDVSNFNTSNVTDMYAMFHQSKSEVINLSNFDTSNVTNMYGMLWDTAALELNLTSFNTSKVTNFEAFIGHGKITSVDVSSFDISKATTVSRMFQRIKAKNIDLSSFVINRSVNTDDMFRESDIEVGTARTQVEADIFNNTTNKPEGLNFKVK